MQLSPRLRLVGVSGYEVAVAHGVEADQLAIVDPYLDQLAEIAQRGHPDVRPDNGGGPRWSPLAEARISTGSPVGSRRWPPLGERGPITEVVLRSGAYLVHDDGVLPLGHPGPIARPAPS